MIKNLKVYYAFVALPFVFMLLCAAYFNKAIVSTIVRNPHPQINYAIFYIILFGGAIIILSAVKSMHEAKTLREYSEAVREKMDIAGLQNIASNYSGDVSTVLQMMAFSRGRAISHQEQVAVEHELSSTRNRLIRRNALPQYLTGLLVGMGLFGTFVGLLSTLSDISILISSFAELDMATASPLVVFRIMIERMRAPMQSMSIAFSASMFGLLGSIVLGLMMVGLRRLQGDIVSVLSSEAARHVEVALLYESVNNEFGAGVGAGVGAKNPNISNSFVGNVSGLSSEDSKALTRIEERLAEVLRSQQRMLASEIEDFQAQRSEILRVLSEQTAATNSYRSELQQLGRQLGTVFSSMEKGNSEIYHQITELIVHMAADAKESQSLLTMQIDEQKRLRETLDSNMNRQ